jgi:hypothetical protein
MIAPIILVVVWIHEIAPKSGTETMTLPLEGLKIKGDITFLRYSSIRTRIRMSMHWRLSYVSCGLLSLDILSRLMIAVNSVYVRRKPLWIKACGRSVAMYNQSGLEGFLRSYASSTEPS